MKNSDKVFTLHLSEHQMNYLRHIWPWLTREYFQETSVSWQEWARDIQRAIQDADRAETEREKRALNFTKGEEENS